MEDVDVVDVVVGQPEPLCRLLLYEVKGRHATQFPLKHGSSNGSINASSLCLPPYLKLRCVGRRMVGPREGRAQ